MAQEDNQKCSNSSSGGCVGGRPSKKAKQKKVPQRGLGVAQLEKIRLEEQQKKEAAVGNIGNIVASSSTSPMGFLPLPRQSSSAVTFQRPPPPTELSGFRPNLDLLVPPPPPPPPLPSKSPLYAHNACKLSNGSGSSIGYFPSVWNPCNCDGDASKFDPGFAFQPLHPVSHMLNDFSAFSTSTIMLHKHQYLKPQQPSLQVNVLSSGPNRPMEPPSNQSCYSNYTLPLLPEEDKMVGMKRAWPFAVENPSAPTVHCNLPQFVPPICRLEESPSCGNVRMYNSDQRDAVLSDGTLGSNSHHIDWRGSLPELNLKGSKENGPLDTLLTLGRPANNSLSASKAQAIQFPSSRYPEFSEFSMHPYQGHTEDRLCGLGGSIQQQPFYSFFPSKGQQDVHSAPNSSDRRSEITESVDLNLKL